MKLIAIVSAVMIAAVVAAGQAPTFSTKIVSVRVDALVLDDRGQPITGLNAADFQVVDDGVPQTVDLIAAGRVPVNVVLALDMSESMAGERLEQLRLAADGVLARLNDGDQAALVTFSEVVARRAALTADIATVRRGLERVRGTGGTALIDATYSALLVGQSDIGRTLAIVFSDGIDTSSWLNPDWVLLAARRSNAVVYSATIGAARDVAFLPDLSRISGGTSYGIESNKDLPGTFAKILDEFRHRYLLSFTPTGVPESGWHQLQVRVKNRRAIVKAREGYGG